MKHKRLLILSSLTGVVSVVFAVSALLYSMREELHLSAEVVTGLWVLSDILSVVLMALGVTLLIMGLRLLRKQEL
jgi:small neutral amino acid transporter SnatA (MarC family)